MKKSKKPRPVVPCWNCGSKKVYPLLKLAYLSLQFHDVRDKGWWLCLGCYATAQEHPTSLGPQPKVMPYGAFTSVIEINKIIELDKERSDRVDQLRRGL